jgi:membrane protein implicated in regulation of membrane protease activity
MNSMRWNWLVLVVGGGIALLIGAASVAVGALRTTQEPIVFFAMGVAFVVGGFVLRRWYRRYEREAMANAAKDLEAESEHTDPANSPIQPHPSTRD